jgi:carbamoylphosphate synthase large subunit
MILVQHQKYSKGLKTNGPLDVSGTRLAQALDIRVYTPRIKCRNSNRSIINYGCSYIPWLSPNQVIYNKPEAIIKACNKIATFAQLTQSEVPIPHWTHLKIAAELWFEVPKAIVFCRTIINGSKGKGIVVARKIEELVDAPLYTLYIPKNEEYRVHVAFNKAIHIQKKLKLTPQELENRGITDTNPLVRNSSNGYVFSSNLTFEYEEDGSYTDTKYFWLTEYAIKAVRSLGLDFGAVDLIVGKDGKCYVLEVNTAPALEEPTLSKYKNAINENIS